MAESLSPRARALGLLRRQFAVSEAATQEGRRPSDLFSVRIFLIAFAGLLAGYMFMGRGFAHVGVPPLYVGEAVLFIGLIATAYAFVRLKLRLHLSPIVWLLLAFMVWGLARTVPYLGTYGTNALRDAVLWGYATFALMLYALADRGLVLRAMAVYGAVVPAFAVWLPICFNLFLVLGASIDPNELGSDIPLIFFKSGDMSVHIVGSLAFLVLGLGAWAGARSFLWRLAIVVPLLWTAFIAGATNRGGLVSVVIGLFVIAVLALLLRRLRNWYPTFGAVPVLAVILAAPGLPLISFVGAPTASPSPTGTVATSADPTPSATPTVPAAAAGSATERPRESAQGSQSAAPPSQASEESAVPSAPPGSGAPSLVPNSGFEVGALNTGQIELWSSGAGASNIVRGDAYRGDRYASVRATGVAGSALLASNSFPVQGHDISVSMRGKALSGSPVLGIYVVWFDASGNHLSSQQVSSLVTAGDEVWQEASGILAAPAEAVEARIHLLDAGEEPGAEVGIDEVVVETGEFSAPPGSGAPSLVPNSGFELGALNAGQIQGWSSGTGAYNIVEGEAYGGDRFAAVHATGEPGTALLASASFPVRAEDISVSVRGKALSGSPVLEIYVLWFDASGNHLSSQHASSLVPDGDDEWQEATGILAAPADAIEAQIHLLDASELPDAAVGIDEVVVKTGDFSAPPGSGAPSLVPNSGFELGALNAGQIEGWSSGAGVYNIVQGEAYGGDRFAYLIGTGEPRSAMMTSATFPLGDEEDISVSVRGRALSGSPVLEIYVQWSAGSGDPISSHLVGSLVTHGDHEWQEALGALKAPAAATEAQIHVWESSELPGAAVAIDEVVVETGDFDVAAPQPPSPLGDGRQATVEQIIENIGSVFTSSPDEGLEGTRQFRLRWWGAIVGYTVFGEHFWTGKGFGVNLADDDGFQATGDGSLRAPHNSHITALARMGVPGFLIWALLQAAFGIGLLRSVVAHRRAGDIALAAVGAWLLSYWTAMMVNTSFDPYIEGPQGGIWFWTVIGLGLVIIRLSSRPRTT